MPNDTETTGIKSLRIFFSYSTKNKSVVGKLKEDLEMLGFEVFLAHEDIEPCIEWQDEIRKNLERCDIFIPLFTPEFKKSDWTDQETGIALSLGKFIIPLYIDIAPYGFLGKTQGLKIELVDAEKDQIAITNGIAEKIQHSILTKSKFAEDMKKFAINSLTVSQSFEQAKFRSKFLRSFENFTAEEIKQIYQITMENIQINQSFGARDNLSSLFNEYKKYLSNQEYEDVIKIFPI